MINSMLRGSVINININGHNILCTLCDMINDSKVCVVSNAVTLITETNDNDEYYIKFKPWTYYDIFNQNNRQYINSNNIDGTTQPSKNIVDNYILYLDKIRESGHEFDIEENLNDFSKLDSDATHLVLHKNLN